MDTPDLTITAKDLTTGARQETHGDFRHNAMVSQKLKDYLRRCFDDRWSWADRESVDAICLKFSRILSGRLSNPDHWLDIAGYAQLIVDDDTLTFTDGKVAFVEVADRAQHLKSLMWHAVSEDAAGAASSVQREAVDMICHYLARIASGGVNDKANWVAIVEIGEAVTAYLEQGNLVAYLEQSNLAADAGFGTASTIKGPAYHSERQDDNGQTAITGSKMMYDDFNTGGPQPPGYDDDAGETPPAEEPLKS